MNGHVIEFQYNKTHHEVDSPEQRRVSLLVIYVYIYVCVFVCVADFLEFVNIILFYFYSIT